MANNRMLLVCNKCFPADQDIWDRGPELWGEVVGLGKWYPAGSYSTWDNEALGKKINDYLDKHAHTEDIAPTYSDNPEHKAALIQNENPVRLVYETWVRDMPAIKKWEMSR